MKWASGLASTFQYYDSKNFRNIRRIYPFLFLLFFPLKQASVAFNGECWQILVRLIFSWSFTCSGENTTSSFGKHSVNETVWKQCCVEEGAVVG